MPKKILLGIALLILLIPIRAQADRANGSKYLLVSGGVGTGSSLSSSGGAYSLVQSLGQSFSMTTFTNATSLKPHYTLQAHYPISWDSEAPSISITSLVSRKGVFISYQVKDNITSSENIVVSDGSRESIPGEDGQGIIGPYSWEELANIDLSAKDEAGNRATKKVSLFREGSQGLAILHYPLSDGILSVQSLLQKEDLSLEYLVIIINSDIPKSIFKGNISSRGPPVSKNSHIIRISIAGIVENNHPFFWKQENNC